LELLRIIASMKTATECASAMGGKRTLRRPGFADQRRHRYLWRPVGPAELSLIAAAGMRAFPPRLPEQPIFYPVTSEDHCREDRARKQDRA
jgi:hypothetical protein